MKRLILLLAVCFLAGCDTNEKVSVNSEVIIIEDCEYLTISGMSKGIAVFSFTHKGNCSNPIHGCQNGIWIPDEWIEDE